MKDKSVAKPTEKLIRKIGQFLVKNWSAFQGGQHVGKMRADLEEFQARAGVQKVDRNRTGNLRQLFVKTAPIKVHRRFTETSPDFEGLSLKTLRYGDGVGSVVLERINIENGRQSDGKMSAFFNHPFVLFPRIAQYMRKVLIQFDIPSSYLYVVVLKRVCL